MLAEQLRQSGRRRIIAEPLVRNTAPAIALADTLVDKGERYQVKRIRVLPGEWRGWG